MEHSRPYTFDRVVRLVITIVCIAGAVWLIDLLKDVLLPFCVACLIAYLLEPIVQYNRSLLHLKGRIVAIFVTLFEVTTGFGLLLYFSLPSIIEEMHQMANLLTNYANSDVTISYLPAELHDFIKSNFDLNQLADMLTKQNMQAVVTKIMSVIHGSLSVLLGFISWLIVFLYVIFIMLDYERLMRGFKLMVPPRARPVAYKIGTDIKNSMNHYFRGQALIACVVAVIYCVGFLLCDLPLAIILGLGTAVLFMIPYMQYLSIIPVTLLCLVESANGGTTGFWTHWFECMSVFVVVQIVADLILTPRIMGKAMGLNPAIILLSLSIWGSLFGLIGMIIALPLTTLILSYYEQYIIMRNKNEPPKQRKKEVEELREMAETEL